jgi:phosphate:Na+ symporter
LECKRTSQSLQKLTANRTRDLMKFISGKRLMGLATGVLLTVLLQSSGAFTSLLVGLCSAGVLSLAESLPVILGTTIGSTLTVQLLSLNITKYGLAVFAFSFFVRFLTNRPGLKKVMTVPLGFGMLFFGLELIGTGTAALRELPDFSQPLQTFNDNPLLVIVVTTILTTIVHSSTVTIGFAMALASQGLLTFESSLFWIFGANIGTTGVALIASLGENETGKQVAWAHTLIKVAGVCLFLPFVSYIGSINLGNTPERGIANFHTFYNILSAFILIPALPLLSKAVQILVPNKKGSDQFGTKYLDRYSWSTSSTPMALAHAEREALRMANIVTKMLAESLNLFRDYNPELAEKISGQDDKVDLLNREIRIFLTEKLDWEVDGSAESQADIMRVFTYVSDLESAADVIDNTLKEMAAKKHSLKLEFSDEAWGDLDQLHKKIMLLNDYSLGCFQRRDKQLGAKAISTKRDIRKLEVTFKESHMARLLEGVKESSRSSSIVMDLLGEMRRISGLLTNHIYQEFGSEDRYNILPRKIK